MSARVYSDSCLSLSGPVTSSIRSEDALFLRLAELEDKLNRVLRELQGASEGEWVTARECAQLLGLRDTKSLTYYQSKGVFDQRACRNVGTALRPRYRYHRKLAVDQFLNRNL